MKQKTPLTLGEIDKFLEHSQKIKPRKPKPAAALVAAAESGPTGSTTAAGGGGDDLGPVTVCLADIEPEPVEWLWEGRIPIGKITIIGGRPGVGKTMLSTYLAARVTTATPWCDGAAPCKLGSVLLVNGEDGLADTLRPRCDAAGADPAKIHALDILGDVPGRSVRWFTMDDIPRLKRAIGEAPDCRLVIIDPAGAFLGDRNENSNGEVRGLLGPLAALAAELRIAIVLIMHLNKSQGTDAMRRFLGSVGWAGAARAAWMIAEDPQDPTDPKRVLMLSVKSNLGAKMHGLAYRIGGDPPSLQWCDGPVTITADELVSMEGKGGEDPSKLEEAGRWLLQFLAAGPVTALTVQEQASKANIRWRTLERASTDLRIVKRPMGPRAPWVWELPHDDPPTTAPQIPPNPRQTPPFPDDGGL